MVTVEKLLNYGEFFSWHSLLFSQNKASRTVADISASGTKLHITYSDGTSKDMEMPPATSLQLPLIYAEDGTVEGYVVVNKGIRDNGDCLAGDAFYYGYSGKSGFNVRGWPRRLSYDDHSN